jgi:hypothetical protein
VTDSKSQSSNVGGDYSIRRSFELSGVQEWINTGFTALTALSPLIAGAFWDRFRVGVRIAEHEKDLYALRATVATLQQGHDTVSGQLHTMSTQMAVLTSQVGDIKQILERERR